MEEFGLAGAWVFAAASGQQRIPAPQHHEAAAVGLAEPQVATGAAAIWARMGNTLVQAKAEAAAPMQEAQRAEEAKAAAAARTCQTAAQQEEPLHARLANTKAA